MPSLLKWLRKLLKWNKKITMNEKYNYKQWISWLIQSIIVLLIASGGHANSNMLNERSPKTDDIKVDFETRVQFYLDLKTKRFLSKMTIKEQLLVELIRQVTAEIQHRGKAGIIEGDAGFDLVYNKSETILKQYEAEIQSIKNIINELERLELTVQRIDDLKLLEEVEQLKDRLQIVLDDQKLATRQLTKQQVAEMIQNYSDEISSILQIYEKIDYFQKRATAANDQEIIKQLNQQKQRIIKILEESRIAGPTSDKVVESYIEEAASIVDILKKIDLLEEKAALDSVTKLDITDVRNNITANIDKRVLELFGYLDGEEFKGITVSEYFNTWKAERIAEYQMKYTSYKILRDNLIQTASPEERDRMLENEISNALLNYSNENYELAELQFQQIFAIYKTYYPDLTAVIFYRSEANFANHYYDAAQAGYLEIINDYPNSQYAGQCYLRLLIISYTYGWHNEFFKYFDKVKDFITIDREDLNNANYLAGYLYIQQKQYEDASRVLENIKDGSKYYLPAQYLLA